MPGRQLYSSTCRTDYKNHGYVPYSKADKPADTSGHERPWWLRCDEARAARKIAADTAVAAHLAATGGQEAESVASSSKTKGGSNADKVKRSTEELLAATGGQGARPVSP